MRVLIRCDGGGGLGAGHVMRSLAVAEAAIVAGHQVDVLGHLADQWLVTAVHASGATLRLCDPGNHLGSSLVSIARDYDLVHIDHYDVDERVHAMLGAAGGSVMMSNVSDGPYGSRPADLSLDAAPDAERVAALAPARLSLRGLRYVLVRSVVLARRPEGGHALPVSDRDMDVVVVMGGTDPQALAPAMIDELARCLRARGSTATVTAIATDTTEPDLNARIDHFPGQLVVQRPGTQLLDLLAAADLVVTAAGTTVWEICVLKRPMVVVAAVDNQRVGRDYVIAAGAAAPISELEIVLASAQRRDELSAIAGEMVDGWGAWRLVQSWELLWPRERAAGRRERHPAILVRPADRIDSAQLLRWRNDPATRAVSRDVGTVDPLTHSCWLETSLARQDRILLIASEGRPSRCARDVGTVRWDRLEEPGGCRWEVSITVAPECRGRGLAVPMLFAAERMLLERLPDTLTGWVATVHIDNLASLRLFRNAGYLPDLPADPAGFVRFSKPVPRG